MGYPWRIAVWQKKKKKYAELFLVLCSRLSTLLVKYGYQNSSLFVFPDTRFKILMAHPKHYKYANGYSGLFERVGEKSAEKYCNFSTSKQKYFV